MKKIVLTSILLLIALSIHAQGIPRGGQARSDLKSVSFTNVSKTITIHKKEIKKYDARVGFQQFVEVAPDTDFDSYTHSGLHLIDGYRFNNNWFVGMGIGLDYYPEHLSSKKRELLIQRPSWGYDYYDYYGSYVSFNKISIPIFIHSRMYLFHSDYSPFISYSLGKRLAADDVGWMHHLSMGCEYQTKEDIRVYASIGFECSNYIDFGVDSDSWRYYYDGICNISGHPRNENHYHYEYDIYEWYSYFLSLRVGVTFSQDKISLMRLTRDGISKLKKK
jgi:hypothetical protein